MRPESRTSYEGALGKKWFAGRAFFVMTFFIIALLLPDDSMAARSRRHKVSKEKYRSAVVMNAETGRILYAENADRPVPPASVAKVLSLYLTYEALSEGNVRLQDKVHISQKAWRTKGSRMFLDPSGELTLDELIRGVSIVSGNDAAVAMAEHIGGDLNHFVMRMNAKARQLGMLNSHFRNPHGLPAKGQLTTARDIAILSRQYLRRFPQSLQIHSIHSYTYRNMTQRNHNLLLSRYPGADGIKTGFTHASGYNLAATAMRGNTRLIAVVLGARTPGIRLQETMRLLDQGFIKNQNSMRER
jgi:D-alanyl-D-alanine carboxypeptidase